MEDSLAEIAGKIMDAENSRKALAARLRSEYMHAKIDEALESGLAHKVEFLPVNASIGAVDGGIAGEELHGFNFLLLRAVAAVFDYRNSKVNSHFYYPSSFPPVQYDIMEGLETHEVSLHSSLFRLKGELCLAADLVRKHNLDFLMMDGSIAPLLSDKPPEDSRVRRLYNEVLADFTSLYAAAWGKGTALLGVIKDSRSRRFMDILQKKLAGAEFANSADTSFLYFLLEEGERTFAFPYSSHPSKHPVLKDLGEWSERINSFYLKPVRNDRPLRIEFMCKKRTASQIASVVHSLSCMHKAYAYPPILIDVDLRAAMAPEEFERAYGRLLSRIGMGTSLMRLRRNQRPFR